MSENDFPRLSTLVPSLSVATDPLIVGLTSDSRKVAPGWLFAALPGSHVDGTRFIEQAIQQGAAAILGPLDALPLVKGIPFIADDNPRQGLSQLAARFYPAQPQTLCAVTGTNGKTSVVTFARQIWEALGFSAASIGTIGIKGTGIDLPGSLTTPDPISLHETLNDLAKRGIDHAALEASSHGLDQFRLDGLNLTAAAFTNLTRDHLDYHKTMEAYTEAKCRLFSELLPFGAGAVINADDPLSARLVDIANKRGLRPILYGMARGGAIRAQVVEKTAHGQRVIIRVSLDDIDESIDFFLPLIGAFQLSNIMCALGLVIACGVDCAKALKVLANLTGVPGRMQLVAQRASGNDAPVYVDYAHTPDALETALRALRPHTARRLVVVFGCGGDRDPGKRPQMGKIAADLADLAIVSDDNPRSENPATIRRAILDACPGGIDIDGRAKAIAFGIAALQSGDILLIAGKGHETTQTIGSTVRHFDDAEEARKAVAALDDRNTGIPLWTAQDAAAATDGILQGTDDWSASGISSNSATITQGDLFIALRGERLNGNEFAADALSKGAAAALVDTKHPRDIAQNAPLLVVNDTMDALTKLARAARARMQGKVIAVTGSVGKTGTKDMISLILSHHGKAHATRGNFNNHWGVPLTLSAMPADCAFGVFEAGMNHAGELTPLSQMIRPHIALITAIEAAHLGHFSSLEAIADAKSEIFDGLQEGGFAIINRDSPYFCRLGARAREKGGAVLGFGSHPQAEASLIEWRLDHWNSHVFARILGHEVHYTLGAPGKHWVINSLGALLSAAVAGVDLSWAMRALALFTPPHGRGERHELALEKGRIVLIDESYNASPASMCAAFEVLSKVSMNSPGRKIAILGDMLELGEQASALHAKLSEKAVNCRLDLVCTAGSLMQNLHDALPAAMRGIHTRDSVEMEELLPTLLRPGDIVLIKGSASSRMGTIVQGLLRRFSPPCPSSHPIG